MKVEITDIGTTKRQMKVTIPRQEVVSVTEEVYRDLTRDVPVKGFRKGKAPRRILKSYYGDYITGELSRKLVREKFEEALKERDLFVVSMPEFDNAEPREDEEFSFTATFDVKPEVTPSVYTGFELKRPKVSVEDKDVDEVIERLRQTFAEVRDAADPQTPAARGDYVIVDITSDEDPSLNREHMTVEAGGRSSFPGLEREVIGMKAQDTREVEITFGEDHFLEDQRGRTVRLKIQAVSVRNRVLPELDDGFAKMVHHSAQNMDELRKAVREDLVARLEGEGRTLMERQVDEKLIEANPFEVPESMVRLQAIMMLQGMSRRLSAQGVRLQDVYPDAEALRDESMASAEKLVRTSLIVEAVAKLQGIEVTDEDMDKEIAKLAERYSMSEDAVRSRFEEQGTMDELKYGILQRRVYDYVIENSTVVDVEKTGEDSAG
jgi:trigger factor